MPRTRIDGRYAAWLAILVLLLLLPAFAGFAGIAWEAFQLAGYIGALACIVLVGAPLRRGSPHPPAWSRFGSIPCSAGSRWPPSPPISGVWCWPTGQ